MEAVVLSANEKVVSPLPSRISQGMLLVASNEPSSTGFLHLADDAGAAVEDVLVERVVEVVETEVEVAAGGVDVTTGEVVVAADEEVVTTDEVVVTTGDVVVTTGGGDAVDVVVGVGVLTSGTSSSILAPTIRAPCLVPSATAGLKTFFM